MLPSRETGGPDSSSHLLTGSTGRGRGGLREGPHPCIYKAGYTCLP
ncbi:unnamed protein product [Gulo gulo]|uniref:Uncharacterized protein n=1 Tax=Gulo gulo TaxID=48420 RepID=A0A9X9Q789_GULGU|nr:unnamed protein product [Gulo gulo]